MQKSPSSTEPRTLRTEKLACDLTVAGGGLAGVCCAITAARAGLKVILIQDRPVLGGNASSEVRLWVLGATSHLGNNNRWAREGGIIDEILVENLYRNPEGNPVLFDALLLEMVAGEPNITLLLNTSVHGLEKSSADTIRCIHAFCSQNATLYTVESPLFCDASGDGIAGFLAGAAFRMGAESFDEFGEKFAPSQPSNALLGHTIYFYTKDTGRPVKFVPPHFALSDITKIPRFGQCTAHDTGCKLWWLEWGGHLDTIHESETIKWELWKVAYGVWNYIKNSGKFPESDTLTLEWVGTIPGKRESRRFEGDYMLTQQDIVEQRQHEDAISFGGWAIDLHPVDGVYSEQPGCTQWHAKGVYQIPYRCLYSHNISNLFLAGRIISVTHIAFGSTRVMATCAHNGQAVGMAAALCLRHNLPPRALASQPYIGELQQQLLGMGHHIPGISLHDPDNLARHAALHASSELILREMAPCGETRPLHNACAMMLPLKAGLVPRMRLLLDVQHDTELLAELRVSSKAANHTPDATVAKLRIPLKAGMRQHVWLDFGVAVEEQQYGFFCLMMNEAVALHLTNQRVTGVLSLAQKFDRAVAKSPCQMPPPDIGIESFEFWIPERRPGGKNFALTLDPPLAAFGVENLKNGFSRPTRQSNAWVAEPEETEPELALIWSTPQTVSRIELDFDPDFDHPLESVQMGHPERSAPFCISQFEIRDGAGKLLHRCEENHQARYSIHLSSPVVLTALKITFARPSEHVSAALFDIRCYSR